MFGALTKIVPLQLSLVVLCILVGGCSSATPASPKPPGLEFEIVSPEEQVAQSLAETPKHFIVEYTEAQHAAERVEYFFQNYTSGFKQIQDQGPSAATIITNRAEASGGYQYTVERTVTAQGFQYIVNCEASGPGAQPAAADRNARNLARFIREGQLEISLISR
ncbi:MAG: hypothetical protein K1X79_10975 [Oligoflexia bacterium]|nr:hypothetical protein [Oligoflexia bacterium]